VLRGRFTSRVQVRSLIVFLYFVMVFAAVRGKALGYLQWAMGDAL